MSETELKFAKKAVAQVCQMFGENGKLLFEYIKLFSSKDKPLSLEETFEILVETANFWVDYPTEIWQKSVRKLLANKVSGSLKTPLLNHDLLIDEMELLADLDRSDNDEIKSPDPPQRTEQQKAHAANHMQNMMSVLNQSPKYGKRP